MRKLLVVLAILVLAISVAVPAMAQEVRPDLADFLVEDGRFNTLLAAVGAAGLTDALATDGPITVLAPTDDAFATLPTGALDFVLDNPDVLTSILTSHVISGAYYLRDIAAGATVDSLGGEPVTFALADGALTANGVTISSVDNLVSSGVVHVLDSVIIPAGIQEALAGATSFVRVAHFSPDGGPVDIYVDGNLVLEGVTFGTISDWLPLVTGVYTIEVAPAGSDDFIRTVTTRVDPGVRITAAAFGQASTGDFTLQFIPEDYSPLGEGQARVTVFHGIQNAPAVDILANGAVALALLGYPGTLGDNDGVDTLNVAAGTYDLQVVPNGATEPVILDLPDVRLNANTYYFVAAIGTPSNPSVALAATPAGE